MTYKKRQKNADFFTCSICNFKCSKKSEYSRHIITRKHEKNVNTYIKTPTDTPSNYICDCGKEYKHRQSLYNHKQKCNYLFIKNDNNDDNDNKQLKTSNGDFVIDKEFVLNILKKNNDLQTQVLETQNQVVELLKNGTHQITNNTNSHNKTFNLNFFLNETCKNAMNIMDFVNNLQLQLDDLEKMGDVGYVNGMSNIIIKNLKDMDVTERPVHCTDVKREVLYVKDEDKWDKEKNNKPKIRKAIKHVAHKNARLLQEFKDKHPDCTKSESKYSDTYNKLFVEAMGGKGNNDDEQESKIIKKVSKEITLAEVNP